MDAIAWTQLEAALLAADVPRSLWPRYFEKEEHRLLRARCRDEDEYRRLLNKRLAEHDHGERERRERWALFLIVLLWILQQQREQPQTARSFVQSGFRALRLTDHGRMDPESAQVALTGVALVNFPFKEVEDALAHGAVSSDGLATCPLSEGLRQLEAADESARQQRDRDAAKPAPTLDSEGVSHDKNR